MAEAYWDMEWTLQQQGFDLCYDKRLYDRLVHDGAESVLGHLQADDEGLREHIPVFSAGAPTRPWTPACTRSTNG